MTETKTSRSARLADQFEAAQESFIRLVESLSDEQWRMTGANTPELQTNNEDETRQVRVIAHHVAVTQDWIMSRIKAILGDRPTPPVDFKVINSEHAVEHADATKAEVVALLRDSLGRIAKDIRAIPAEKLDIAREVPSGKMSVQERIERVLIGHMKSHQGSIEATIS
jgi:DinB superfamily